MKFCPKCKIDKNESEFNKAMNRKDGLCYSCRGCYSDYHKKYHIENKQRIGAKSKKRREDNPGKMTDWHRMNYYNLSPDSFLILLEKQVNCCRICKKKFTELLTPCVDHDHSCCPGKTSCGKCIRALLCGPCNNGLGCFKDNPNLLHSAEEYLRSLNAQSSSD